MLRRQGARDPMNFLAGDGEMATRIREFDWASHPFGPPETWPQSLRSAISICLNSAFPTAIYWGVDLRLLYNDAWAPIPGPRHPDALGAPAREVWADIWHVIEPQFIQLIETGRGVFFENELLPMRRYGYEEETYWTYSFTPIQGEDGGIVGVFNTGSETTDIVLTRRVSQFLLSLSDRLRESGSREEALEVMLWSLGEHMGVARAGLREFDAIENDMPLSGAWNAPGIDPAGAVLAYADFHPEIGRKLHAGETLRYNNTDIPEARDMKKAGWGASLVIPWRERGELRSILFAHRTEPHHWTDSEVSAATRALDSTMNWFGRLDALAREQVMAREIDHRARNLLAVIRSIVRLTSAEDVPALRDKILDRMGALSSTHTLLSERHWTNLTVKRLLDQELAPYTAGDHGSVTLSGPRVTLAPETAQAVAMVFHELATNAAKHGALSRDGGRLEIGWTLDPEGTLSLVWQEGGCVPAGGSREAGFGSTLLSEVVEGQLRGEIVRRFEPDGFRCAIALPVTKAPAEQRKPVPPGNRKEPPSREGSILIVEDEMIVAMDLAETVKSLGYSIFASAADVESGLAALAEASPAAAILDANLGGESSRPIAKLLAERGVPIIVVSGYSNTGLGEGFAGCTRMTKPIFDDDLARALAQAIDGAETRAERTAT